MLALTPFSTSFAQEKNTEPAPPLTGTKNTIKEVKTNNLLGTTGEDTALNTEIIDESDTIDPTVIAAESEYIDSVIITFSEDLLLPPETPELEFTITEEFDTTKELEVLAAEIVKDHPDQIKLTTANQKKGESYTVIVSANITDLAGNPIVSGVTDTATFIGTNKKMTKTEETVSPPSTETKHVETEPVIEEPIADTTPPEDITELLLSFEKQLDKFLIHVTWIPSVNSAGDLIDQMIYMSLDQGNTFNKGKSLGANAKKYDLNNMKGGKEYTFKITTKDLSGNESLGVIKSIRLPQTGPFTAIGVALSTGVGYFIYRKKKK